MINRKLALVGLGKQASKGAAAANPTYAFGLLDGAPFAPEMSQEPDDLTGTSPYPQALNRTEYKPGLDFTTRAYPRSVGAALLGALGAIATSGPVGGVYTHVITDAFDTNYWTFFARLGADYLKIPDAKIDELVLSWEGAGPLEVALKAMGLSFEVLGAPWVAGVTETDASGGKFRASGGTYRLDVDGAVLATAKVRAGELTITRGIDAPVLSASILPNDVVPASAEVTYKLTLVPDDLTDWRAVATGTPAGTQVSQVPVYGSFETTFVIDANTDLKLDAPRVGFAIPFPDADPAGGAVELEAEGTVVAPAASEEFTATLRNAVASY